MFGKLCVMGPLFFWLYLCLCIFHYECSVTNTTTMSDLKKLYTDLLTGYDVRVKPRFVQSAPMEVGSSFYLYSINSLDTTGQRVNVAGFFNFTWSDDCLVWNPDDYGGTTSVKIPLYQIWYPRMAINSVGMGRQLIGDAEIDRTNVTFDGKVTWVPEGRYSFGCEVSVKYYPFDQQNCMFVYYISDELTIHLLILEEVRTSHVENSEWDLVKVTTHLDSMFETYIVQVSVKLNRRPQFAVYTLFIPLITLSVLNAFTLLFPVESGEKVSLSITIFLAYAFFISITTEDLPHNSIEVSYYLVYMTGLLLYSALSILFIIIEGRFNAKYGNKLISKMRNSVESVKIKELSVTEDVDTNDAVEAHNGYDRTWSDYLKTLDIIACLVSLLFLLIFSGVLFGIMVNRGQ